MENLLSLNIKINLIRIDDIWFILDNISEKQIKNKSYIMGEGKSIFGMLSFIQNILDRLIFIVKNNNIINIDNIIHEINRIINDTEERIRNLKIKLVEIYNFINKSEHEDIGVILSYFETVIKNGYINFDEYKKQNRIL